MSMLPPIVASTAVKKRVIQIRIKAPVAAGKSVVSSVIATALQELGFEVALDDRDAAEFDDDRARGRRLAQDLARQNTMIVIVEDSK